MAMDFLEEVRTEDRDLSERFDPVLEPNLIRGLIVGAAAGIAASLVMNVFQSLITNIFESGAPDKPNREQGAQKQKAQRSAARRSDKKEQDEPATVTTARLVSEGLLGRKLLKREEETAGQIMHYVMGAVSGAMYGAAAEYFPDASVGFGTAFGTAVWLVADEGVLPISGLTKSPMKFPLSVHAKALASHWVYGAATEISRRAFGALT